MFFDIRTIVGSLLGLYGIVLVITGLVHNTADEEAKTGGVNLNLWVGLGMIVVALAFVAWTWLRPVRVESTGTEDPTSTPDAES